MIKEGDVKITIPMKPGDYGSGMSSFSIPKPKPGEPAPKLVMYARVQNGRLVPGVTRVEFHPALDNKLWISTPSMEITPEGDIRANLSGWSDMNVQKAFLGVDRVPLEMTQLYDLVQARSKEMEKSAKSFMGENNPFDSDAYDLVLENATMLPGTIPTGDPNMVITLGAGTKASIRANAQGVELNSTNLVISRIDMKNDKVEVKGVNMRAAGKLVASFNPDGSIARFHTDLTKLSVAAESVKLHDNKGTTVNLGRTSIAGADLRMTVDAKTSKTLGTTYFRVPDAQTQIESASFAVAEDKVQGSLSLGPSRVRAGFVVAQDELDFYLAEAKLDVEGKDIVAGQGAMQIKYANASINGTGKLTYKNGRTSFEGDLRLNGTVSDAKIGYSDRAASVDVAAGANIDLKVTQASFGGTEPRTLSASGELDVLLDSGKVVLASGGDLILKKGRAKISIAEASVEGDKLAMRGRFELDLAADANVDPSKIAVPGAKITTVSGITGSTRVVFEDVELKKDGTMRIGSYDAELHATVSKISGKLTPPKSSKAATDHSRAATTTVNLASAAATSPPIEPDPAKLLDAVKNADLTITFPLQAGDMDMMTIRPNTIATITVAVRNGQIVRSASQVTFNPKLDGPLWVEGAGIDVDANGHFILVNDWGPDFDLTTNKKSPLRNVTMPTQVSGIIALGGSLNSAMPSGSGPIAANQPLKALKDAGAVVMLRNVSFGDSPIALDKEGKSFITPDPLNRFSLDIAGGQAVLNGSVDIKDGTIATGGATMSGISGRASLSVLVRGDGDEQEITGSLNNGALTIKATEAVRTNGDKLKLGESRVGRANIILSMPAHKGKPTFIGRFSEVTTSVAPSRVTVQTKDGLVPVDIPSGTLRNGTVEISGDKLTASGDVTDAKITAAGFTLPTQGFELKVKDPVVAFNGKMSFESGKSLHLGGKITLDGSVNGGAFGGKADALSMKIGVGTNAHLELSDLDLGVTKGSTVAVEGKGKVNLALQGGHVRLPNGLELEIMKGTGAVFNVDKLRYQGTDNFATIDGSMRFRARMTTKIPAGGREIAPGVKIFSIGENSDQVDVVISRFALRPDGSFSLGNVQLDAVMKGANIQGAAIRPAA